jgi:sterol desaturase/sphingolipid hydroxylase (fatty acid hydroxylase superfamily)
MRLQLMLVGALVGLALLLFVLERLRPLRRSTHALVGRLLVNIVISALAFVVAAVLIRPFVERFTHWTAQEPFGLAQVLPLPQVARAAIAFLLMDLSFYYWHLANHRVSLLWRFHNVHHIDPDLDVSTALRFHFGEVAFSAGFRVLQVILIGVSPLTYALYEIAFQAETLFHHSNVRLPIALERLLNLVLVTPRMHGIHHSQVRRENNSNFSVVLSFWDRLHRTVRLNVPQTALAIGIPAYTSPEDHRLWNALAMPFRRQRDYWRRPDGSQMIEREPSSMDTDVGRLAE